ncbi:MAG: homocysteine S-methyltransferase family protein [Pseudomonadota bacterium]|nr:homocysteine S-methyltransferase family protein [Pseudomonadota bacterium]
MIILDGGLGRQLQAMGAPFRQPEWSALALIEAPQTVRDAHDAFIAAGADVITTNTYAIVPFHIGEERYEAQSEELLTLAAKLARDAADAVPHAVQVAASIPPMFGSYKPDAFEVQGARRMMQHFRRFLAPVADIFFGETLSSISEVTTYLDMFTDCAADLWVSVTLEDADPVAGKPRLRSGEPLSELLLSIEGARFDALLFNCSQPEVMNDAVAMSRAELEAFSNQHGAARPMIGAYANAFPLMDDNYEAANENIHQLRKDITSDAYLRFAHEWAESGADIIGGCCGITPDHIRRLAETFKAPPPVTAPDYA